MRRMFVLAVTVIALTGCGKKKEDKKGPDLPAGNPTGVAPAVPVGGAAGGKVTCDEVIPTAARDKYFAGLTFEEKAGHTPTTVECKFEKADDPMKNVSLSVTCDENMVTDYTIKAVKERRQPDTTDLDGLGRAAMQSKMQVTFWDDDSPCFVIVTSLGDADKVAVAKEISASLKADVIAN